MSKSRVAVEFEHERDTKRTYRFREVVENNDTPVIGTLYVQQSMFDEQPNRLMVTIEVIE